MAPGPLPGPPREFAWPELSGKFLVERIDLLLFSIIRWPVFYRFWANGPCELLPANGFALTLDSSTPLIELRPVPTICYKCFYCRALGCCRDSLLANGLLALWLPRLEPPTPSGECNLSDISLKFDILLLAWPECLIRNISFTPLFFQKLN